MSIPSIKVGQGNWGIKAGNLLGYANTEKKFSPVEFTSTRALDTATRVNASGNIEIVNANIPRIDYFGGQASLLVEPSGTNGIRNNSMVGAVTGSPGALPTGGGWSTVLRGLTQTIVGAGTENGIAYIDIRFSGTATSTDVVEIRYESNTQIVASSGQVWTNSIYSKKIAEPNPPNNYQLSIYERDNVGGFVAFGSLTIVPTTTTQRFTQTRTLSGATTARVQPALFFNVTNLQAYDFTIRIGYPQMEQSSVATSVIPTTTGSVTRNADVISVSGAVSGSIGQTEGTVFIDFVYRRNAPDGLIPILLTNTSVDQVYVHIRTSGAIGVDYYFNSSFSAQLFTATGFVVNNTRYKVAFVYKENDFALYINGQQIATHNSGIVRSLTSLHFVYPYLTGYGPAGQTVNQAALYATRLSNAELAALTSL